MKLGVAYYPEHEEARQWASDYRKLANAGIGAVRIAEFAWAALEPQDGVYRWEWLDAAIEEAGRHGLQVVLCTPTACPPVWLAERFPDILPVNKEGRTIGFGARQHRSYRSEAYVSYSLRIVRLMAERYGAHPNVVAWQLDNEFGGETKYDYGEPAKKAFHAYLARRYGTIAELNRRWGAAFWSQTYERFDQVPLPKPIGADVMMWHHPSLELDFARFSSESITQFASAQAAALRPHIGDRPMTTNAFMFRWGDNIDWPALFDSLDIVGMDIYSDRPHEIAFYADACRGVLRKPFWMMEYGSGAANLAEGMTLARERGCERFFLFKAKPFPWGQEQGSGEAELLTLTGEPSANYAVVRRFAEGAAPAVRDRCETGARVGIYYHFPSSWSYRVAVADRLDVPSAVVDTVYRALYERSAAVDIVYKPAQLEGLDLLIVPHHVLYDAELEEALPAFVRRGGKLAATNDLFRKNEDNVYLTRVPAVYPNAFGWTANNFVPDTPSANAIVRAATGLGQSWLVPRGLSAAGWAGLVGELLGEEARA